MYMCAADIPAADVEAWYGKTMADLQQLQYLWQFKINTTGTGHYVDAGPAGCDIAPLEKNYSDGSPSGGPYLADGPYIGTCPLHLETVKQPDGKAKVYFWVNSYSSPHLARRQESPSKSLPQSAKSQSPSRLQRRLQRRSPHLPQRRRSMQRASTPVATNCARDSRKFSRGARRRSEGLTLRALWRIVPVRDRRRLLQLAGATSCSVNAAAAVGTPTSAKDASLS